MDQIKRDKIKSTLQETRAKRVLQKCRVIQTKVNDSTLNLKSREALFMKFTEAKWLYNHILNLLNDGQNIFKINYKDHKTVQVKNKNDEFELRTLNFLTAWERQHLIQIMTQSIKSLSTKKKRNQKVGKLKFKSEYNSIELGPFSAPQNNRVKIIGIKQHLKLYGLEQIKSEYEIANAKLIKKPSGYYIYITCYEFCKQNNKKLTEDVGIDFGIKSHLTLSNGQIYNASIDESDRLKKLQRKFAKQQKGSNNRFKTLTKIKREYEKMSNKKNDLANKMVYDICSRFDKVFIQDENLSGWHSGLFGKQVQHSVLGRVKSKLREKPNVFVLERNFPSTKMCYNCGTINEIPLSQRIYRCDCGVEEDRDVKAAKTILKVGSIKFNFIPMDDGKFTPVENYSDSLKQESFYISKEISIL